MKLCDQHPENGKNCYFQQQQNIAKYFLVCHEIYMYLYRSKLLSENLLKRSEVHEKLVPLYCLVLLDIVWYCMELFGIVWSCTKPNATQANLTNLPAWNIVEHSECNSICRIIIS